MSNITVSAPGKLMLFGEHAVVYKRACLVTAVSQRMLAEVEIIPKNELIIDAIDVDIKGYRKPLSLLGTGKMQKGAQFIEIAVKNVLEKYKQNKGLYISTSSEFSSRMGFGSSSASTVCIIKAMSELYALHLSSKQIFELAYKTVIDIQGKGSGFDVAAAVYGGILFFVSGGDEILPVTVDSFPLIVGYSGVKADTVSLINQVTLKRDKYPLLINGIFDNISQLVAMAKEHILQKDWQTVGELMNINQGYLEGLGVGSNKLSGMIYAARSAGAYGAKLSGAGGGDCMIALASESLVPAVKEGIQSAGGQVVEIETNARGVCIEKRA